MDARVWEKIFKTLMATDKMAKFEYLGDGVDEGIRIVSSSPNYSFCQILVNKGWAESIEISGDKVGESFVLDLSETQNIIKGIRGQRTTTLEINSDLDEHFVTISGPGGSSQIEKRFVEVIRQIPEVASKVIKFRISGAKVRRVLSSIKGSNDTVNVTFGKYKIEARIGPQSHINEGCGICFWATEADEIFISSEPLGAGIKLDDHPEGFSNQFLVESLANAVNEVGTARKEAMEISEGPDTPIRLRFRLAETVFVEYIQSPKKVVELPEPTV
jgi:hypothetical protein